MKTGIVILGHGSRREEANAEVRELVTIMQDNKGVQENYLNDEVLYEAAFLSFGEPDLEMAVDGMVEKEVEKIVVIPLFLVTGNHIKQDIPEEMDKLVSKYPRVEFVRSRHLGIHPALVDIIQERIQEVEAEASK